MARNLLWTSDVSRTEPHVHYIINIYNVKSVSKTAASFSLLRNANDATSTRFAAFAKFYFYFSVIIFHTLFLRYPEFSMPIALHSFITEIHYKWSLSIGCIWWTILIKNEINKSTCMLFRIESIYPRDAIDSMKVECFRFHLELDYHLYLLFIHVWFSDIIYLICFRCSFNCLLALLL